MDLNPGLLLWVFLIVTPAIILLVWRQVLAPAPYLR